MSVRKRVNISITPELYKRLKEICRNYGFKNPCNFTVTLLNMAIRRMESGSDDNKEDEEIQDLFSGFSQWERTPDKQTPLKKHRQRTLSDYGKG